MVRDELQKRSIEALRARDKVTRAQLSGVLGLFTEQEKAVGFDGWTEESQRALVARYVKSLKGASESMGDHPQAAAYRREIELLAPYLPQLLGEAETRAIVEPLVAECTALGQLMGRVMKDHKGKVDPQLVRSIAQELGL